MELQEQKHKYLKSLLITLAGIIFIAGTGFGVWWWQNGELQKQQSDSDTRIAAMQKQIDDLKKEQTTTTTTKPAQSTANTNPSGSATEGSSLPTIVGACTNTSIASIQTRLPGSPSSMGMSVNYDNGGYQVSYDNPASIQDWQKSDQVKMCLVSIPTNCPAGDNRGKVYKTTNLKTNEVWEAPDASHSCGGA